MLNLSPLRRLPVLALLLCLPLAARAATLNVPAQYATIQAAINAAHNGDTVLVADGTYTGPGNVDLEPSLGSAQNLTFASQHGASKTIIDCGGSAAVNHRGFNLNGSGENYVISGLTIKNGYVNFRSSNAGAAITIGGGCTATLANCVFTNNTADGGMGGAVYINSTTTIRGCTVTGNSAYAGGGIYIDQEGLMTTANSVVTSNTATTTGGGIYNASVGIPSYNIPPPSLTDCIVSGNMAQNGGGLYNSASFISTGCTFSANSATQKGGSVYGTAELTDCILYSDAAPADAEIGIAGNDTPYSAVTYSDIQGGYAGTGNINADPLFVNAAGGDFHLKAGSPVIGRGIAVEGVTTDFDGVTRPNAPSIGAYEYVAAAPVVHTWTATAIAAGPDGKTRILWDNTSGAATIWMLNADGSVASYGSTYGPLAGWTARTISVGADNATRILWTNTSGAMTVWTLPAGGSTPTYGPVYGPYAGWTATSIATDTQNATHVLWNNTNGSMTLWTLPVTGSPAYSPVFGPFAGWTAKAVSTDTNNAAHVLWSNTSGAMTLWTVAANGTASYGPLYGPYAGWAATALSVDSSNANHVLWDNANGAMTLWTLPASGTGNVYGPMFGPYAGWTAVSLSVSSDGNSHVLWGNAGGSMTPWTLDASGQFVGTFPTYGPY